jgi:hypothetical protein
MIGLDTECPETIAIGTNKLIGTDPSDLPPAAGAVDFGTVENRFDSSEMERQGGRADRQESGMIAGE